MPHTHVCAYLCNTVSGTRGPGELIYNILYTHWVLAMVLRDLGPSWEGDS